MKNKLVLYFISILCITFFQQCTTKLKESQKVISQELLYDSINKESNFFDVDLTTIIEFRDTDSARNNFNNLSLIIEKDTFPLIPDIGNKEFIKERNTLKIKFGIKTKFVSKTFKNDTLTNKILTSEVINDKIKKIQKDSSFTFHSLILGYPVKEGGMKLE